jgi:hypothetical protein
MLQYPGREDRVYAWVVAHYNDLAERIPDIQQANIALLTTGCSRERLAEIESFFAMPEHRPIGIESTLAQQVSMISDCVALREREGAAVSAYLEGELGARE